MREGEIERRDSAVDQSPCLRDSPSLHPSIPLSLRLSITPSAEQSPARLEQPRPRLLSYGHRPLVVVEVAVEVVGLQDVAELVVAEGDNHLERAGHLLLEFK